MQACSSASGCSGSAKHLPIVVVAPQPWFPGQQLIRWFRPHFRPMALKREVMDGVVVHRPRFFCIPGILKWTDGLFMALSSFFVVRRIARDHHANIIDAHFGYPTGYAAVLLGRWLQLPVMLTLRGKEERQARTPVAAATQASDYRRRSTDYGVGRVANACHRTRSESGARAGDRQRR